MASLRPKTCARFDFACNRAAYYSRRASSCPWGSSDRRRHPPRYHPGRGLAIHPWFRRFDGHRPSCSACSGGSDSSHRGKQWGRLGVLIVDTATGATIENRADERFPLTSTFKFLAAAAVLKLVDAGERQLDRTIRYTEADIEPTYSPVTKNHVGVGMSIVDLCAAAVVLSDNTAGNLLLRILGGPEGLTRFCRSLDDHVTRLDRTEPTLNSAIPGDDRDTTSPRVMVANMRRILLGNTLSAASRQRLETWLIDDKVGGNRLRAGIPSTWRIGDKTGSGENGTAKTIGILWPPSNSPILAAVYYTGSTEPRDRLNTVHAEIGRLVADTFGT
jgi:beta-lactamase class A